MKNNSHTTIQKTTIFLLYLLAVVWTILGIWSLVRTGKQPLSLAIQVFLALMMFGNAAGFAVCGLGLKKSVKYFYQLTFVFILINIILTFTDEFGLYDLLTGLVDIAIFILLILFRKNYYQK